MAVPTTYDLRPLARSAADQGDPFLFRAPVNVQTRYRYYIVVTGPGLPIYGSDHPTVPGSWQLLGPSVPELEDVPRDAWAPCVRYVPHLPRPWVMLFSLAEGTGDPGGHIGHKIRRATAMHPHGPYVLSHDVLTPDLPFAIDPEVSRVDGQLVMAFVADSVDDEPYGSGLWMAGISPDLSRLDTAPQPVLRAAPGTDWQVYDPQRVMPWMNIPGVDWSQGDTVNWHCVEAPCLLGRSPRGVETMLYSAGRYSEWYGIGIARLKGGRWVDYSPIAGQALIPPALGGEAAGHCSALVHPGVPLLALHVGTSPRQFTVVRLAWDPDTDLPVIRG
jgi:hypothetical protein